MVKAPESTREAIAACGVCGLVQEVEGLPPGGEALCRRCGETLCWSRTSTRRRTAALALAALLLAVPAMVFPLAKVTYMGNFSEVSLTQAVGRLFEKGHFLIGGFLILTAIAAPIVQAIGWCLLTLTIGHERWRRVSRAAHRWVAAAGPWDMAPLYLVALIVGIVKFGGAGNVHAGTGAIAFALMIVAVKAAAVTFDPAEIWIPEGS